MSTILSQKISTKIGTAVLITAMGFNIITVSTNAFTKGIGDIESSQKNQLDLIQEATGDNLDINNIDNWNTYSNDKYGFSVRYPEILTKPEDESEKPYSEDYSEASAQTIKISFKKFVVRVWENPDNLELKNYLASDNFCAIDKAFCRSFKNSEEISLTKTTIAENDWYQTVNKPQRFFISSPDNNYILDFELINLRYKIEFNKIISTLEFQI